MTESICNIPCDQIVPGDNDRQLFDQVAMEELAASIAAHGLAQPITVRPIGDGFYEIVAGERRFRAVQIILGLDTIPCIVRDLGDEEASAIMLVENTGRKDLNPIEEAQAYQARIDRFGWSVERIAQTAGKSPELVNRRLSLLRLVPEAQHLVAFSHLPLGHAEAMTKLDANRQRIAMKVYMESESGLTITQFRHIVAELFEEQSQDSLFGLESFWIQQVQSASPLPLRGKHAYTGAPTRADLPPIQASGTDSTAAVIDRWIAEMIAQGLQSEAAVAGTLYTALVRLNYLSVPPNARLIS